MLDIRKLRMLSRLQRLGTITAVAEELHLTAPGVSMQLAALEKELEVQLTERRGRRVALTAAGIVLAEHGHEILDRISLAELELDSIRAGTIGRYVLAAFPSAARTFVADALRRNSERFTLDVHLKTSEPEAALDALGAGSVDLAVVHSYTNVPRVIPRGVTTETIGTEPVWLAVRRTHATLGGSGSARLEDYAEQPWIVPTDDLTCFTMVERACSMAGFQPRIAAETMDFAVQLELVAAGVGVALVPDLTVASLPSGVELRRTAIPIERTILLAARSPRFADPGIGRLAQLILRCAATRLTPVEQPPVR